MHPHETQFRYDNALLSSCASSELAHSIKSHLNGELKSYDKSAPTWQKKHQNNIRGTAANNIVCKSLFQQHAIHYKRPILTNEEEQFWNMWEVDNNTQHRNIKMSTRIETFLNSVLFVHEHNTNIADKTHKVGLNRFSDMSSHELPLMPQSSSTTNSDNFDPLQSTLNSFLPHLHMDRSDSKHNPVFTPIDDDETILKFGRTINQLQEGSDIPKENVFQRMRDSWWWLGGDHSHGNTQEDDTTTNPLTRHSRKKIMKKSKDNSSLLDKQNKMGGLSNDSDNDKWLHHLNWATDDNPGKSALVLFHHEHADGVPIVHNAMDQGLCGSCWAISATGTLEASIARNMAYISYEDAYSFASSQKHSDEQDINPQLFAVAAAQQIERQSISTADLSVQELVDCDTKYDQGCAGGNPLLAFYFLHRFGVTSTKNYPYTGTMGTCKYHKVDQPIATVKTWGILTPDHEENIEKVVRYIGPVAVGLIGADPAFLSYESGVFMSTKGKEGKCETSQADHAMLIVGYGDDLSEDGSVQRYWICRNSWGKGWGENGYVRVARTGGKKGHRGECGIARSPSVALGGMFTEDVQLDPSGVYGSNRSGEKEDSQSDSLYSGKSTMIAQASSEIQSAVHRLRYKIGFIQKGILMSTIDGNENRKDGFTMSFAGLMLIMAGLLLLKQTFLRRSCRRPREVYERHESNGDSSIATSLSTRALMHGTQGDLRRDRHQTTSSHAERIHLLEGSSGTLYT